MYFILYLLTVTFPLSYFSTVHLYQRSLKLKEVIHIQDFFFSTSYLRQTSIHVLNEANKSNVSEISLSRTISNFISRLNNVELELIAQGFESNEHNATVLSGNRHKINKRDILVDFGPILNLFGGASESEVQEIYNKLNALEKIYNENESHSEEIFSKVITDIIHIRNTLRSTSNSHSKEIKLLACIIQLSTAVQSLEYNLVKVMDTSSKIEKNEISHFLFYKLDAFLLNKTKNLIPAFKLNNISLASSSLVSYKNASILYQQVTIPLLEDYNGCEKNEVNPVNLKCDRFFWTPNLNSCQIYNEMKFCKIRVCKIHPANHMTHCLMLNSTYVKVSLNSEKICTLKTSKDLLTDQITTILVPRKATIKIPLHSSLICNWTLQIDQFLTHEFDFKDDFRIFNLSQTENLMNLDFNSSLNIQLQSKVSSNIFAKMHEFSNFAGNYIKSNTALFSTMTAITSLFCVLFIFSCYKGYFCKFIICLKNSNVWKKSMKNEKVDITNIKTSYIDPNNLLSKDLIAKVILNSSNTKTESNKSTKKEGNIFTPIPIPKPISESSSESNYSESGNVNEIEVIAEIHSSKQLDENPKNRSNKSKPFNDLSDFLTNKKEKEICSSTPKNSVGSNEYIDFNPDTHYIDNEGNISMEEDFYTAIEMSEQFYNEFHDYYEENDSLN